MTSGDYRMLYWLLACTAQDNPSGGFDVVSETGAYTLTITTDPDPLLAGAAVLTVDAPGTTALSMDGEMPSMGHGFSEEPVETSLGQGTWEVSCIFPMAGTWTLWFDLDGEEGADSAETSMEVQ